MAEVVWRCKWWVSWSLGRKFAVRKRRTYELVDWKTFKCCFDSNQITIKSFRNYDPYGFGFVCDQIVEDLRVVSSSQDKWLRILFNRNCFAYSFYIVFSVHSSWCLLHILSDYTIDQHPVSSSPFPIQFNLHVPPSIFYGIYFHTTRRSLLFKNRLTILCRRRRCTHLS